MDILMESLRFLMGIIISVLPFVIMFALGLLIPVLIVLTYSRFAAGMVIIFGMYLIDVLLIGSGGLYVGIMLYYTDIALGLVAFSVLLRMFFAQDFPLRHRGWVLFFVIFCVNLILGLAIHGSTAGVQARPNFYYIAAGLYAMSFPMDERRLRLIFNAFSLIAFIFVCLSAYRWVVYYLPITSLLPEGGVYNIDGSIRVIYSNSSLVIAQVFVVGMFFAAVARGFTIAKYLAPVLFGVTLALQHRSVWLAALAGVLVFFMLMRSKSGSMSSQLLLLAGIVAVTATPMLLSDKVSGVTEQIGMSANRALHGESTTGARWNNWKATLDQWSHGGIKTVLIGHNYGGDTTRIVENGNSGTVKITYAAHNLYVETLTSFGVLGLLAFFAANWYVLLGLYRIHRDGGDSAETDVLLVLMVMQLTYYVAYGADYLQCFIFGVSLAYVASYKVSSSSVNVLLRPHSARLA